MAIARAHRALAGIDLNLLPVLDALLGEAHVTRAARRVGLSQSAMSHALTRLRAVLGDPLLVRAGRGMALTPKARAIAEPLARALAALERTLGPRAPFDPSAAVRELRVAAIDFAQLVLLPPLVLALAAEAPGITLAVVPAAEPLERALGDGAVDLAIGLEREAPGLTRRRLLDERFVCVVRAAHPSGGRKLSLAQFTRHPHVMVSPRGRAAGAVDAALRPRGATRRITLTVPHTLAAALVVERSDAILTVAERVARVALAGLDLRVVESPVEVAPFSVSMFWHPRHDADPTHVFLRERLAHVVREV